MSFTVGLGVVSDGQCIFKLPYPLAHLSDLTMKLLGVGEDESGAFRSKKGMLQRIVHSPRAMARAQRT